MPLGDDGANHKIELYTQSIYLRKWVQVLVVVVVVVVFVCFACVLSCHMSHVLNDCGGSRVCMYT